MAFKQLNHDERYSSLKILVNYQKMHKIMVTSSNAIFCKNTESFCHLYNMPDCKQLLLLKLIKIMFMSKLIAFTPVEA